MKGGLEERVITVYPGDLVFERSPFKIQTLLGSCVAITVWHPELLVGGLCHYLLPLPLKKSEGNDNYRYASCALQELVRRMQSFSHIKEFQFGLYGGSEVINSSRVEAIGMSNINFALEWLNDKNINVVNQSVGGKVYRNICLCLFSGEIDLRVSRLEPKE